MKGFTRVFLIGYLGRDPELQTSKNGAPYTKLNVSTHRSRKLDDGKWDTSTEWHKIMVWGARAELCARSLSKGSPVAVEGYLESYKYEREGGAVTQVAIVADHVHFLPNPKQQTLDIHSLPENESADLFGDLSA